MLSDPDLLRLKLLADSHRDHEPVTVTAGELRELIAEYREVEPIKNVGEKYDAWLERVTKYQRARRKSKRTKSRVKAGVA